MNKRQADNEEEYIDDAFDQSGSDEEEDEVKEDPMQNVDQEVAQVIRGKDKDKPTGGYMIPDDEDVSEEPPMERDEEMDEADNEHEEGIDQDDEEEEDEDIEQQIVNITNKNAHHE